MSELYEGGDHEGGEGDLDGADAALVAFQGGVDRVGGVVAVGPEDLQHGPAQPARMGVATVTMLVTVRPAPMVMFVAVFVVVAVSVRPVAVAMVSVVVIVVAGHALLVWVRWWRPPVTRWSAWRRASAARCSMCSLRAA